MRPFLSETRLFSTRHKRPILRFTTSIKHVYLATPELRRRMRYCHFARRLDLKHCRLGLGVARQRDDLCLMSFAYDRQVVRDMHHAVRRVVMSLNGVDPNYWQLWDRFSDIE